VHGRDPALILGQENVPRARRKSIQGNVGLATFVLRLGTRWKWVAAQHFIPDPTPERNVSPIPVVLDGGWAPGPQW